MNLKDIIELAKQGYTVSDVKELIALSNENSENEAEKNPVEEVPEDDLKEDIPAEQKTEVPPAGDDNSIDYKKLYEDSQAMLREAQKANVNRNIEPSTEDDNRKRLQEAIRGFM